MKSIVRWKEGFVVWAFPFWRWLMDRGIEIVDFDTVDYNSWANEGFDGLRKTCSPEIFSYFKRNTCEPSRYQDDLLFLLSSQESFRYNFVRPSLDDLRKALEQDAVCEAVVDSCSLNQVDGFSLHRIVVLNIDDTHVTFHDPVKPSDPPRPNRREKIDIFLRAWPSKMGGPDSAELCVYRKKK